MPLYEYVCPDDGETITLLRSMNAADEPVEDPAGRGRTFVRRHSTFSFGASDQTSAAASGPGCACGNPYGPCNTGGA